MGVGGVLGVMVAGRPSGIRSDEVTQQTFFVCFFSQPRKRVVDTLSPVDDRRGSDRADAGTCSGRGGLAE